MKKKLTEEALEYIDDAFIREAAAPKRRTPWIGAVAAALVVVLLTGILWKPAPQNVTLQEPTRAPTEGLTLPHSTLFTDPITVKYAIVNAEYPVLSKYPIDYTPDAYSAWWSDQRALHNQPLGYGDNLGDYFSKIVPALLANNEGKNAACSPVNIYMAMAMLAEITGGESRQQVLDLLNADSIDSLRTQARHVWRGHYNNDGLSTSILGSSLWLEEGFQYSEDTVKLLAENYYASVFRGDLGSAEIDEALQGWLNQQTMGLLEDSVQNVHLDPSTILALATTICYQAQWADAFNEELNTEEVFHGVNADTTEIFMNTQLMYGPYYWSKNFSAVHLRLKDGSVMWLILPDEGTSPEAILKSGEVADFFAQQPQYPDTTWENKQQLRVNLSLPKFDIRSDSEISESLKKLGITDIFDFEKADLSPIIPQEDAGFVNHVTHAARIKIDEAGLTAAAFTVLNYAGSAAPPTDEVDFIADRPFLFFVCSQDNLPLFAGIVNEP